MSLLETMIAILILAVGILGVSGLQALSLQQNRNALFRADALQFGNDILDRIRANRSSRYAPVTLDAAPSAGRNCIRELCNHAEMAAFDIAQWKCSLNSNDSEGNPYSLCESYGIKGSIPQGAGSIFLIKGVYEITVQWVDDHKGNTDFITLRTQVN